ncbi:RusA family crossover junction endodeoxyribonuclease [Faecalibaculum rodentium]|uniref:RusA family crossover junction endodeoxyribonuclease n=1 Tax=Faecalibaculum rodentium TaxID=1702221 RepID=UPI00272FC683|nr:RusA family crossover junction endodeoxyribonuclease [Faecalibaculum rodentium]
MSQVEFSIPGEPCAKGRPRFIRATGQVMTPEKTSRYEQLVQLSYMQHVGQEVTLHGPVKAHIRAYFSIPKSISQRKREQMISGDLKPLKKPDADNIAKIVLDALNGMAYQDDKEVAALLVEKHWAEKPMVCVTLSEI